MENQRTTCANYVSLSVAVVKYTHCSLMNVLMILLVVACCFVSLPLVESFLVQPHQKLHPQHLQYQRKKLSSIRIGQQYHRYRHSWYHHLLPTTLPTRSSVTVNADNNKDNNNKSKFHASSLDSQQQEQQLSPTPTPTSTIQRFLEALPLGLGQRQGQPHQQHRPLLDSLDQLILQTSIPSILNLVVVPLVNAVDTFYVGRLGLALALAGQSAANQASFTVFFLIAFVPNITAPLVASAVASGRPEEAQARVCESLFLCQLLGLCGTLLLVTCPRIILSTLLLPPDAPAMDYAIPYLRWRALGMIPSLIGATGSAAFRGLLDTVTPLKVSLMTNAVNLVLDPLLMFGITINKNAWLWSFSYVGAAMATAASEMLGGITYLHLLLQRNLARWTLLWKPPSWQSLRPLLQGGTAMLLRQLALNVGFLVATRRAQQMDPTGVTGAAYGITMQIYSVGIIALVGMQNAAATLVPSARAKNQQQNQQNHHDNNDEVARRTADRLLGWSTLMGILLGVGQFLLLPILVPLFSTLDTVQQAVRRPTLIASLIHMVNGPVLAGEGILMGLASYQALAIITMVYIASMVTCLTCSPLGQRLDGIMWSILLSSVVQLIGVIGHYWKVGPLAVPKKRKDRNQNTAITTTTIKTNE
jgi:multidrug resistance protein, MATE family